MQDTYIYLSIISTILAIGAVIGTILAYLQNTKGQIQERAIDAMEQEIASLKRRLDSMEQENKRLEQIIATICEALKKRGLDVTIDGHIVTVSDGNVTQSVRIQGI